MNIVTGAGGGHSAGVVASFAIIIWIQRGGTISLPVPNEYHYLTYGKSGTVYAGETTVAASAGHTDLAWNSLPGWSSRLTDGGRVVR